MAAEDPWAAMERQILSTFHVFCAPSTVHGWGVFAGKDFKRHEVVHEATGHLVRGQPEAIEDDVFDSGSIVGEAEASGFSILGQGFATLHNHQDDPNVGFFWERPERHDKRIVGTFYARRPISKGEELFISYGPDWLQSREGQFEAGFAPQSEEV